MTLDKRTAQALSKEADRRSGHDVQRLNEINDRFERLVKAGAVQPERYNIAPINPSSMLNAYTVA